MNCLPKHITERFISKLKDGTITPEKMLNMNSEQRRTFLGGIVGEENTQWVNTLFESKMILKNQQRGIITWAKQTIKEPKIQKDVLSRVNKMTEILTPITQDAFLEDLAAHKLGVAVTMEEATNIVSLSKEVEANKMEMEKSKRRGIDEPATEKELKYGSALVSFNNYINGLKAQASKKNILQSVQDYIDSPIDLVNDIFGAAKSIVGSLDDSFIGRQGIKEFLKGVSGSKDSMKNWIGTFNKSIDAIVKTFKGQSAIDAQAARHISDPRFDLMKKAKLAIGTTEEAYPSNWPEKIPVFGTLFKAGEEAFIVSAHEMRYRAFLNYLKVWETSGIELTDLELQSIGQLVNSLTARGDTGVRQKPGLINNLLWSPRMIKADLDFLTAHVFSGKKMSKKAKIEAAKNLIRVIAATAGILALADWLDDDSVTWDTKSSDFGKIKVGDTRFSVAGSLPAYIILASRIINKARTSSTGDIIKYNEGKYGESTMKDMVFSFFENKASPPTRFILDWLEGKDFQGEKFNLQKELIKTWTPLQISNYIETAQSEDAANMLVILFAETFGINTNTYEDKSNKKKEYKFFSK
jgi:hypothetical protein